jgi:hypothetical protein
MNRNKLEGSRDATTGTSPLWLAVIDPHDLAACHVDPATTPFNGEHEAGPVAMISAPDASSGLGPLCTHPDTSTTPAHCSR